MSVLNDLKWNYNYNLGRYYKGCEYCSKHKKETNKWIKELLEILDNMETLLTEISKTEDVSQQQILGGFLIGNK